MKKGMLLKKKPSRSSTDVYILVKGICGPNILADMYFFSDNMEKDRRFRGAVLPVFPVLENFKVIHPFSPEIDLVRSLFRLPSLH